MEYSKTKRDIQMHKRRKQNLVMPNTPITEIVLGKYEANEARIKEISAILSSNKCIVDKLIIEQN